VDGMSDTIGPDRRRVLAAVALAAGALAFGARVPPAGAMTISPQPGTPDASPSTQISFLGVPPTEVHEIAAVGSRSGAHTGRLRAYDSSAGASFLPDRPFIQGETVHATAIIGTKGPRRRVRTSFTIARLASFGSAAPPGPRVRSATIAPGTLQSFASQPGLHPPSVQVLVDSPQATTGDVLLAPAHGPGQHGPMILDGSGQLLWFQPAPRGDVAMDLQESRYAGQPVLTWWQGRIIAVGIGLGSDVIYNSSYQELAQIDAGNGYYADLHELQITPTGAAFITTYSAVRADLSQAGGSRRGVVLDAIVQEIDIRTGLVMFEWHALGHVPLTDSFVRPSPGIPWDYFHVNSISLDPWGDGDFIVSARNTWAAYEISAHTGAVLWSIGGKHPSFAMGSGTGMAWQHDVRWQPDGTLTVFDDGALPRVHSQSRAISERIDWAHRKVRLVSRYAHSPAVISGSQGNDEPLADGDTFVGWGEAPLISEFGADGGTLFDLRLPPQVQSYRAYRVSWSGQPAVPPAVAVQAAGEGATTVYASWNGATTVRYWRILGGQSPDSVQPLATSPRAGFETAVTVHGSYTWFEAQALGENGEPLASSGVIAR
jgi:Arylsulfotransferase (ASST)